MTSEEPSVVRLMHYDPTWPQEYAQTRSSLLYACEGWLSEVEHIGSTSIPGLIAQPTIDVLAGVRNQDEMEEVRPRIEGLNFFAVESDPSSDPSYILTKPRRLLEGQSEPTHRVFLTTIDSPIWEQAMIVRDYLRSSAEDALKYEEIKMLHWKRCGGDRKQYDTAKSTYLTHLVDQIRASRQSPPPNA